jgi:hemolysin activation/secretion protein
MIPMSIPMSNRKFTTIVCLLAGLPLAFTATAAAQVNYYGGYPGSMMVPSGTDSLSAPNTTPMTMPREHEKPTLQVAPQAPIVQVDKDVFNVQRIDVEGNSIISNEEMRRMVAPYEGRELTPADLTELVNKINETYRLKGYLTSLAFVPPQDLERGAITVKVLEGMIGDMEVTGNKYFKAKVIANRIAENPGEPLNIPKLEKELLRINRTEPYRLKASLTPGDRTGETNLRLEVKEQQPYQVALLADNAGRPGIGTYRYGTELTDRNVTGRGDRLSARWLMGAGQQLLSTGYTLPVGNRGAEVSALFGFSHVNVDLASLGIQNQPSLIGNSYNYGLLYSRPFDRERVWVMDVGVNARRASSFFDGEKTRTNDIRSATLGLNFDKYDRLGRTFARVQTTFAPQWLGANTSFFKLENYATRVTRLPKNNLLILRGYSQWSPDALPPIEQFQLGGINSVRGYSQGLLIGDRGYNLNAEWRWPIPMMNRVNPWLDQRLQGAFFFDYGQVFMDKSNRNFIAGLSNSRHRTSLMGAGVGLRAHLTDYMQGYADLGFGLVNRSDVELNAQPTMRVHFGVRSELLSNDYKSRTDKVTPIKTDFIRPKSVGMIRQEDLQGDVADPTLEPEENIKTRIR